MRCCQRRGTTGSRGLPNLDIEIRHRRPADGESEQILISLHARPSFEAFGRFLDTSNPMAFWLGLMRLAGPLGSAASQRQLRKSICQVMKNNPGGWFAGGRLMASA